MELFSPSRKTEFVTFYSFKGGVGRTMALINAAAILAGRGRRVLMIDFDLEAPGLTLFEGRLQDAETAAPGPGLVELIHDFLSDPKASPLADTENKAAFRERYVRSLPIPEKLKRLEGGYLDLMPCGQLDATYEQRLYEIKFDQLYEEGIGQPLFQHLKKVIREADLYDYVLIDSRTGLSDEGSICTNDLADHLVVLLGLNRQNVQGTVRFLNKLRDNDWKKGRILFVASPVPTHYEELREARMTQAKEAIAKTGFKADPMFRIPYHPRLALDEDPFIFDWSSTDLFYAYEGLVGELRGMAQEHPEDWANEAFQAINEGAFEAAQHKLHEVAAASPDLANMVLALTTGDAMNQNAALRAQADPFFALWLDVSDDEIAVRQRFADVLALRGDHDRALEELARALEAARNQKDERRVLDLRFRQGQMFYNVGRYEEALGEYQAVLQGRETLGDRRGVAVTRTSIGQVHQVHSDYEAALKAYEEALQVLHELGDRRSAAVTRSHIGDVHHQRGDYEAALKAYEEALQVLDELDDRRNAAATRTGIGQVHEVHGDYEAALKAYEEALQVLDELDDRRNAAATRVYIGQMHRQRGDYEAALKAYEEALQVLDELGHRRNAAPTRTYIGQVHQERGDYEAALQAFEESLKVQEEIGNRRGAATTRAYIGDVHRQRGDYEAALQAFEESLKVQEEIGNREGAATTRSEIGRIKVLTGEVDEGLRVLETTIQTLEALGARGILARRRMFYAEALLSANDPDAAAQYLDEHWPSIEQYASADAKAEAHVVRARIKAAQGDEAGAAEDARVALEFYHSQNVHTALAKEAEELASAEATDE